LSSSDRSRRYALRRPLTVSRNGSPLTRLYAWAFIVRVLVGFVAYGLTFYADLPIVEDARYYEEAGYEVARDWLSGREVDLGTLGQGAETARPLVIGIASFYYVLGGVRALPVLIVVFAAITAVVPIYVYFIARQLQVPGVAARRAAWLVALSPAFVFWSGSLYKEGLTLLILGVATYHTLELQAYWRVRSIVLVALCLLVLWGLRYYLAVLLTLAITVGLIWGRGGRRSGGTLVLVRQAAVVMAFMAVIAVLGIGERTEHVLLESDEGVLVDLDVRRAWSASSAQSGYLQDASIASPADALVYFPVGLLYFLTVPFPWQIGAFRLNVILPENAFWLMLYPLIAIGIARGFRVNRQGTLFIVLVTAGMCAVYALLAANVGTAYRMRSQVWLLWAPFAAWGWELWRDGRRGVGRGRSTKREGSVRSK
jgi:hypothetical protein